MTGIWSGLIYNLQVNLRLKHQVLPLNRKPHSWTLRPPPPSANSEICQGLGFGRYVDNSLYHLHTQAIHKLIIPTFILLLINLGVRHALHPQSSYFNQFWRNIDKKQPMPYLQVIFKCLYACSTFMTKPVYQARPTQILHNLSAF